MWKVAASSDVLVEGGRLHTCVEGRYITLFRHGGLSCIDSICHHAGGPLTAGPLQDIEDLQITVVLCPWHRWMVDIASGRKAYQAIDVSSGGQPVNTGWRLGKVTQRVHQVKEDSTGLYVIMNCDSEPCASDKDACSEPCAGGLSPPLSAFVPVPVEREC